MLSLPSGPATVQVQIIDATAVMTNIPNSVFFQHNPKGFDTFKGRCSPFLITHTDNNSEKRRVLFELGVRKDWRNLVPRNVEMVEGWMKMFGFTIMVEKDVAEILGENGVDPGSIEAVIWRVCCPFSLGLSNMCPLKADESTSHGHFDHIGNMQTFPSNVDLIVGPGITEAYMPGWPQRDVPLQETDFAGRKVREMSLEGSDLKIGSFRALDYFGDGSFCLLDAPGVSAARSHLE
jgi:hypothetical protein